MQGPHEEVIGVNSYAEMLGTRSSASNVRTKSTHLLQGALKLLPTVDSVYCVRWRKTSAPLIRLKEEARR